MGSKKCYSYVNLSGGWGPLPPPPSESAHAKGEGYMYMYFGFSADAVDVLVHVKYIHILENEIFRESFVC